MLFKWLRERKDRYGREGGWYLRVGEVERTDYEWVAYVGPVFTSTPDLPARRFYWFCEENTRLGIPYHTSAATLLTSVKEAQEQAQEFVRECMLYAGVIDLEAERKGQLSHKSSKSDKPSEP